MKKLFLIFTGFLMGCQSLDQVSFSGSQQNFTLRHYEEEVLSNGLRILYIPDTSLPVVSLSLLIKAGATHDGEGLQGLNFVTANLLSQGTAKRSATKFAEDMGQIASELGVSAGSDFTQVSAGALVSHKEILLDLFAEAIMSPGFKFEEINRLKSQIAARIQRAADQPSSFADLMLSRRVYQKHAYASPAYGNENSLKSINQAQITRHYFKFYRPNNAILALTGKFDRSFKEKVKVKMLQWSKRDVDSLSAGEVVGPSVAETVLITKPGLQQTQIRFGHVGIKRTNPDFLSLRLASLILGGGFTSRLNQRIRDDLGLTYSIYSQSDTRLLGGSFEISTFTRNDKVFETVDETKKVLKRFVESGVTSEEVTAAKTLMIGQFPAAIETADRLANNLMILRFYGISDDYLKNYAQNLNAISVSQINQAIRRNIKPDQFKIVMYADKALVADQIKKLGNVTEESLR